VFSTIINRIRRLEERKAEAAQRPRCSSPTLPWDAIADGSARDMPEWQYLYERSEITDVPDLPRVNGLRELGGEHGQRSGVNTYEDEDKAAGHDAQAPEGYGGGRPED
jgi:hypothetical protein